MDEKYSLDIITEVINIGIGEAANALSKLTNTRIMIKVPEARIMTIAETYEYVRKEPVFSGIYISQGFKGLGRGRTLIFYTKEACISLLKVLCGQVTSEIVLSEPEIAALHEVGNIVMGSCIVEISNLLESRISFDLPDVRVETSEKYFQNMLKELEDSDKVIVVKNEMHIKGTDIHSHLFLFFAFKDFHSVIDKLGEKMKQV